MKVDVTKINYEQASKVLQEELSKYSNQAKLNKLEIRDIRILDRFFENLKQYKYIVEYGFLKDKEVKITRKSWGIRDVKYISKIKFNPEYKNTDFYKELVAKANKERLQKQEERIQQRINLKIEAYLSSLREKVEAGEKIDYPKVGLRLSAYYDFYRATVKEIPLLDLSDQDKDIALAEDLISEDEYRKSNIYYIILNAKDFSEQKDYGDIIVYANAYKIYIKQEEKLCRVEKN